MHLRYTICYDIGVLDKKICLYIYCIPMRKKKSPQLLPNPTPVNHDLIKTNIHYLGCPLTRFSFSCQIIFLYIFLWTFKNLTPRPMIAPSLLRGTWFEKKKSHLNLPYLRMLPHVSTFLAIRYFRRFFFIYSNVKIQSPILAQPYPGNKDLNNFNQHFLRVYSHKSQLFRPFDFWEDFKRLFPIYSYVKPHLLPKCAPLPSYH